MYPSKISDEGLAFGERAAVQLGASQGAIPIVAVSWGLSFDREGREQAELRLRAKLEFDRAWENWRDAAHAVSVAGARYFGPGRWPTVAADLEANAVPLLQGESG